MSLNEYSSDHGQCPTCGRCRCCGSYGFSFRFPTWQDITSNPIDYNNDIVNGINSLIDRARVDSSLQITEKDIRAAFPL